MKAAPTPHWNQWDPQTPFPPSGLAEFKDHTFDALVVPRLLQRKKVAAILDAEGLPPSRPIDARNARGLARRSLEDTRHLWVFARLADLGSASDFAEVRMAFAPNTPPLHLCGRYGWARNEEAPGVNGGPQMIGDGCDGPLSGQGHIWWDATRPKSCFARNDRPGITTRTLRVEIDGEEGTRFDLIAIHGQRPDRREISRAARSICVVRHRFYCTSLQYSKAPSGHLAGFGDCR